MVKFAFCGSLEAPEWLLAEIGVLSKISSVRVKLLVKQVVAEIISGTLNFEKIQSIIKNDTFTLSDKQATVSALHFIVTNAAKYDVDDATLSQELQQLGLPKENCDGIARSYRTSRDDLRESLHSAALRLPRATSVEWRVDRVLASSDQDSLETPTVTLRLKTSHSLSVPPPHPSAAPSISTAGAGDGTAADSAISGDGSGADGGSGADVAFEMTQEKFRVLMADLTRARHLMSTH